jgi:hypothetical protein
MTSESEPNSKIDSFKFYGEWKGHPISDLVTFRNITLTERPDKPIIYFAGDSSLDNKFWVNRPDEYVPDEIPEIYHKTLKDPAKPKPDVAYWMNHILGDRATCINTAVEESLLRERDTNLLAHDEFIRDNIRPADTLVISIGANDIALSPTVATSTHMFQLAWLTPRKSIENGTAWGLAYFKDMFGAKIQDYIAKLTAKTKPRAVIVCMIYFPLEAGRGQTGWADTKLNLLGYNTNPGQLQAAIRTLFEIATREIEVEGTQIVPCKLFEVLDGKVEKEYMDRVEPSSEGGKKMAEEFVRLLDGLVDGGSSSSNGEAVVRE